jgi:hypothetical protein
VQLPVAVKGQMVVGCGTLQYSGESEPTGPAQTHPGSMQLMGKIWDDAVIVQPGVDIGVGVGDALYILQRLLKEAGGFTLAFMFASVSSIL